MLGCSLCSYKDGFNKSSIVVAFCFSFSDAQNVTGTKTFQDGLTFEDDVTLDGLIDTINIRAMADDAVYKTGDHVITADKTFTAPVQTQEMNVTG